MTKIGIIFGGMSAEHEVSIKSAKAVYKNLNRELFEPVLIFISKKGRWSLVDESFFKHKKVITSYSFIPWENGFSDPHNLDILFPLLHGPNGEDGKIQGIFEMAKVPFVGTNSFSSALAMNKYISKQLFREAGLNTPDFLIFNNIDIPSIIKTSETKFSYPIFVKPNSLGSSVGISKVSNKSEFSKAVESAFKYDSTIIVEESINCREIEICAMGNNEIRISNPGEIIPFNEFYDYEDKYILGKTQFLIPAPLEIGVLNKIKDMAKKAYKVLFLNGFARIDFLIDKINQDIYINEINTIPGFTDISMFPKLWKEEGISYKKLITLLINLGFEYFNNTSKYHGFIETPEN